MLLQETDKHASSAFQKECATPIPPCAQFFFWGPEGRMNFTPTDARNCLSIREATDSQDKPWRLKYLILNLAEPSTMSTVKDANTRV
ncbi:hypothetical protein CEXT_342071 [Caerostris extrusa]|uniref:Uncharacterized protein n=1 Tax=Caerostris extrusa TaxID=172846 RepID=A0AAV4X2Q8_CAEEX|nr:hypothetical protein CEXT_342071 [Caerostris extrusa]